MGPAGAQGTGDCQPTHRGSQRRAPSSICRPFTRRPPMIRVLIVEEVRAICEIIATVLRAEPDVEVTGCATQLEEAVACLSECDVVLVNTTLHNEASARLIRTLRKLAPKVKIVVMGLVRSQHAILQCIEAGVSGYVLKDSTFEELLKNIRRSEERRVGKECRSQWWA